MRLCSPQLDATAESLQAGLHFGVGGKGRTCLAVQSDVAEPVSQPAKPEKDSRQARGCKKNRLTQNPLRPQRTKKKEETEFPGWGAVLRKSPEASCHPLYGVLQGSSAYLRGDFVLM